MNSNFSIFRSRVLGWKSCLRRRIRPLGWIGALAFAAGAGRAAALHGIPYKPDPPFALDGDLGDWASVPNAFVFRRPAQVVWGRGAWTGPADLSGRGWIAWRRDHLYIAVEVTDDLVRQSQPGSGMWRGDHVELFLDTAPELEPNRSGFGRGQFQFAFSPGNFRHTGDPLVDCPPGAWCFRPAGTSAESVRVASKRTARGWQLEAAIPWRLLGVKNPKAGMPLNYELALSDTDSDEPRQETMMTTSSARWAIRRDRLNPGALAGSDGKAVLAVRRVAVADRVELGPGARRTLSFSCPAVPSGRIAVLALEARLDTPHVAGHTPALRLRLNGKVLDGARLLNKPRRAKARCGKIWSLVAGDRFTTYYAPDFTSPDRDPHYGLLDGIRACLFELRVTDLLAAGTNRLEIENAAAPNVRRRLIAARVRVEFRPPPPPPKERAPAPTGPLPVYEPRRAFRLSYRAKQLPGGRIEVRFAGRRIVIESRFSTPKPAWVAGENAYFRFQRRLETAPEMIVVRDTFTNRTDQPLALMHRYELRIPQGKARVWLAGIERPGQATRVSEPANPTSFAAVAGAGIGLAALDDVFRLHVLNYRAGGRLGLADNQFALKPHASYTAVWAVIPVDRPDYWRFINALRRRMSANFTIPGAFAFLRADPRITGKWSDAQIRSFIRLKDAQYVCASITYPMYKGRYPHGTAFQRIDHQNFRNAFARWRRLVPQAKELVYFHCFLDVTDDGPKRFAGARVLRPDGRQADYGKPWQRIYCPTLENAYGRAVSRNIDIIFNEIGADGVYWDEHEYSSTRYHYGSPWDGVSCDIDPIKMTVNRFKSSVTLLSEGWRLALAKRILKHGPLIGNGPPLTRAMAALHFPCFVETGSITNCARAHLYSPIALGDHLTERSELDAYHTMLAALDFGCVYHWYNDVTVIPTHHHLVRYMYPITPMELHAGYIIGRERIITRRSGLFGWGDDSAMEVHVFDHTGREVRGFKAPRVRKNGRTYVELRLPGEWSAAIVRKAH